MNEVSFMDMDSFSGTDLYSFIDNMNSNDTDEDVFADLDLTSVDSNDMVEEEF